MSRARVYPERTTRSLQTSASLKSFFFKGLLKDVRV
jgi:hypothetical protein